MKQTATFFPPGHDLMSIDSCGDPVIQFFDVAPRAGCAQDSNINKIAAKAVFIVTPSSEKSSSTEIQIEDLKRVCLCDSGKNNRPASVHIWQRCPPQPLPKRPPRGRRRA